MTTFQGARRAAGRMLAVGAVVGAVVAGVVAVDRARPDEEVAVAADPLQVATAERTDLSADATLDGTVESSSSQSVLHRIEGATPSTGSASASSQGGTGSAPTGGAVQGVAFVQLPPVSSVAEPTTTQPTTTQPTTTVADTTTAPDTTVPDTTVPDTTVPDTTVPDTTVPVDSTVVGGAPGAVPGGGAIPGGGLGGGAGGGGSVTGSDSTTSITERVTSLPAVGATIELGDVLYTVDGAPVVALTGTLPAWRSLSTSSDDGADIAQLELSLAALGYDADGSLVVDDEYDSATTEAVEAWQTGLGLAATGEVELGDVVFLPGSVTVTGLDTTVGADVTEADHILEVSGSSQQVVATVTEEVESVVVPGLHVQIGADAGAVDGVVTLLRSVAADDGTVTVEAVIAPTTEMAGQADGSTVDVTVAVEGPTDAITVPADAIASRLDGTYAVEVRDDSGDRWVAVEVIEVRGSKVAVSGIEAGTRVLVPT